MYQINIYQAKTQLSILLKEAAQGEEIIIAKSGKPITKLLPLSEATAKVRKLGGLKGQIWLANDINAPC
jgi:prevent-host-death family protein